MAWRAARRRRAEIQNLPPLERAAAIQAENERLNRRTQRRWALRARGQRFLRRKLDSSFVTYLSYNEETQIVHAQLGVHRYSYLNVPPLIFTQWWKGAATCRTTDRLREWWAGKTPSLGAFYNDNIVRWEGEEGNKHRHYFYTEVHGWV